VHYFNKCCIFVRLFKTLRLFLIITVFCFSWNFNRAIVAGVVKVPHRPRFAAASGGDYGVEKNFVTQMQEDI
jgi:hypothetical protein